MTLGRRHLGLCMLAAVFLALGACSAKISAGADEVCFSGRCVKVQIVQKEEEMMRGLQFRTSLGEDEGMLFVFPSSDVYPFWMKDTKIPLDIVWLDYGKRVVDIARNAVPCTADPCQNYTPSGEALYVVEMNAGHAEKIGILPGSQAEFRLRSL